MLTPVKILITVIGFVMSFTLKGQSLMTTFPQLNAGGQINSVIEDSLNNKVYVAGNFTSIGGIGRKNIARLHHNVAANTYSVDAGWNPVTSMTGEIYSIAKYNNRIYLAGNFTSINGNTAFAYLRRTDTTAGSSIDTWNAGMIGPSASVNDLFVDGTNLYVAGNAAVYDNGGTLRYNVCSFNAATGALNSWNPNTHPNNSSMNWGSLEIAKLKITPNYVYICGRNFGGSLNDGIVALVKSTAGAFLSFNPVFTFEQVIDCEIYLNKIFIVNSKIWPGGDAVYELDQTSGAVNPGAVSFGSGNPQSIERYKNYLFISGTYQSLQSQPQNYLGVVDINSSVPYTRLSWIPAPNSAMDNSSALKIIRNHLYVSDNNLSNISSTARNGVAFYCLEPHNPYTFSAYDQNVCQEENNVVYAVTPVPYAESYLWFYSGNDVTITNNGSNSVQLNFGPNATNGNINVVAVSYCGLYSDTLSLPVNIYPRPDANAGTDSTLTCIRTSLQLNGSSVTSGTGYSWSGPGSFTSSLEDPAITINGNYILTVTETFTGCFQRDTVFIGIDTITPDVIMPSGPFVLTCVIDSVYLDGNSSTTNISQYWNKQGAGIYSDPFYADTIGQYYYVVINNVNGCRDSSSVVITENRISPDIFLTSHSGITGLIIDTLTCIKDSILVSGGSTNSNPLFEWADTSGIISVNDSILISATGSYSFTVTDAINGCSAIRNFYISEFITPPLIYIASDTFFINCSVDSVLLPATTITPGCSENWSGPNGFTGGNPSVANDTGYYYFTAIRNDNGCIRTDSVFVNRIPLIIVDAGNDTLVCKNSIVELNAVLTGNISSLNYSWQPGNINVNPFLVTVDSTTNYIVNVNDGTGCAGTDTIIVFVSLSIEDSVLTFASCDSTIGQIQIYVNGGFPPYSYSIDNGLNFQPQNIFDVPFGNFSILILDSLGCSHITTAEVNENSQLPVPFFLASTYNFIEDTIILVDLSNPQPDSLLWEFPLECNIINTDEQNPVIVFSDTGTFQIKLTGYFSGCTSEYSKTIFVRNTDTSFATELNENGIKELNLYPNPNTGNFTVEIKLHKRQNIALIISDMNGYVVFNDSFYETDYEIRNVQLQNVINGNYVLRVVSEYESKHVYFIISGR